MNALLLFRALIVVPPVLVVCAVLFQPFVDPRLLVLDPMVAAEVSGECCRTYYGVVSTLGIFVWTATAAICAFSFWLLRHLHAPSKLQSFALIAALFTGWLGIDDAFLLHENLLPKLGISQVLVLFSYMGFASLYGYAVLTRLIRPDLWLFVLSALVLGASVGLDLVLHSTNSIIVTFEDGFKFIGICCWFGFHIHLMARMVLDALKAPHATSDAPLSQAGAVQRGMVS